MRPIACLWLLSVAFVSFPGSASGQCEDWKAGPFQVGQAGNGANDVVQSLLSWDPDADGPLPARLVAGGRFDSIGGVATGNIAYRDPASGEWRPFASNSPFTTVGQLAARGVQLFAAAGTYLPTPGLEVGQWNGSQWAGAGTGNCEPDFVNMLPNSVSALGIFDGELVAGGDFLAFAQGDPPGGCTGQHGHALAKWDVTGRWRESFGPLSGTVGCLAQHGTRLFVGGSSLSWPFETGTHNLVAWDGAAWSSDGLEADGPVWALQPWNGGLVAAGSFTEIGGQAANHIAFFDGVSWHPLGSGLDVLVNCMTVYKGELVAGGGFLYAGGVQVGYIARWNGVAWQPLGQGLNGDPYAMIVHDGELVVGGPFTIADGRIANRIARWNGTRWSSFGGGTVDYVAAFTLMGSRVVAGGSFEQSTRTVQPAQNIVSWDGAGLSPFGAGLNGTVWALESFKYAGINGATELIAGGGFTEAGGLPAARIARWVERPTGGPLPAWEPMGTGFDGNVFAIERHAGVTYAAGEFTNSASPVARVARWNESTDTWESLAGGMNNDVRALKSFGGHLYAGGAFTTAGGAPTGPLARWDGTTWSAVGGPFVGVIEALEVHGGELVIAGSFTGPAGSTDIVKFDGVTFSPMGSGTDHPILALHSSGDRLYAGGFFSIIGGIPAQQAAYWDGVQQTWNALPGGPGSTVVSLYSHRGEAHFGGNFRSVGAGALSTPGWARFTESGIPWFARQPLSRTVDYRADAYFSADLASGYDDAVLRWHKDGAPLQDGPTLGGSTIVGSGTKDLMVLFVAHYDAGAYRVVASSACGSDSSGIATLQLNPTVDAAGSALPGRTALEAVGPNPARGPTRISFALAHRGAVQLAIHDISGRRVRTLSPGSLPAGRHHASWDGLSEGGVPAPTGIYFVSFGVDGAARGARRITLLR